MGKQNAMGAIANCSMARSISYNLAPILTWNSEAKVNFKRKGMKINISYFSEEKKTSDFPNVAGAYLSFH